LFIKEKKEQQEKIDHAKLLEQNKKEHNNLTGEAIEWLQSRGLKLNKDFTIDNAIDIANNIAFKEEVKRNIAYNIWFEFDGNDNCENCRGWDGKDRRCDCGNRRVNWIPSGDHNFKYPMIYAEVD
jgi:hypothetical protein